MKRILLISLLLLSVFASSAQVLLSESFNVTTRTATPPAGWTTTGNGTNYGGCSSTVTWEQVPSLGFTCSFASPNPTAHSGTGMAGYNSWDISYGSASDLVTPSLDFSAAGTNTVSLWVYNSSFYYLHDSIIVFVNTSPTSTGATRLMGFDPTYNATPNGWVQYSAQIPTTFTSTTNYIIFRGQSMYGYDVFFDDIEVDHNPPTPCSGTPLAPSVTNTAMSTSSPLCAGNSVTLNAVDPNFPTIGGITYQWQVSSSATGPWSNVSTGSGATTLSYNTGSISTSAYYRMGCYCAGSGITSWSSAYFVIVGAPQPGAITGNAAFCPGDPSTYTVPAVAGTTYTWTLPAGWSGTSTTNSITVTPGSSAGNISVTATSSCGTSIPQTKAIALGSAPGAPTSITGPTSSCANAAQTYSISAVTGATSYTWAVPTGWSINSIAPNGLSMSVVTGTNSGNITATAVNGCGSSSLNLAVTVVTTLPNPGAISSNPPPTNNTYCAGAIYTFSVAPVPGATSYVWSVPLGWIAVPSGDSVQVFPSAASGTISVTAYSNCSTSPTSSMSAAGSSSVTPTVSVSTAASPICQNTPITFSANATNAGTAPTYIWKKNGTIVLSSGSSYVDNHLFTGDIITSTLVSNAACRTSDTIVSAPLTLSVTTQALPGVSINTVPVVTICAGTTVNLTTTTVDGGTSPLYQWYSNGIAIPGAITPTYTSSTIANHDSLSVQMTTSAACPYVPSVFSNKVGFTVNNVVFPTATIAASSTTPSAGMPITFTATVSGGGASPVFQWIVNGMDVPGETAGIFTTSSLNAGDHVALRMLSYDPCAQPGLVMSNEIVMTGTTGISTVSGWAGAVSVYPNPNSGQFTLAAIWSADHIGSRVSIDVLNMVGQSVYHSEVAPDRTQWHFDVRLPEGAANGHYVLRLTSNDGMRASRPFVLNR